MGKILGNLIERVLATGKPAKLSDEERRQFDRQMQEELAPLAEEKRKATARAYLELERVRVD